MLERRMILARHKLSKRLRVFWLDEFDNYVAHNDESVRVQLKQIIEDYDIIITQSITDHDAAIVYKLSTQLMNIYDMLYLDGNDK